MVIVIMPYQMCLFVLLHHILLVLSLCFIKLMQWKCLVRWQLKIVSYEKTPKTVYFAYRNQLITSNRILILILINHQKANLTAYFVFALCIRNAHIRTCEIQYLYCYPLYIIYPTVNQSSGGHTIIFCQQVYNALTLVQLFVIFHFRSYFQSTLTERQWLVSLSLFLHFSL